ncbi:MAG: 6-phosphogluconolactonase [Kiritimatiellia bacterium]
MEYREFPNKQALEDAGLALLAGAMCQGDASPRALMLTGGSTPFGIYQALGARGLKADPGLHVYVSDERYVPLETGDSNYGRMRGMLDAVGVQHRVIVDSGVPPAVAASRYANDLAQLIEKGVSLPLGILGLGGDGHVAALFNREQIDRSRGRLAMAVHRPDGMTGITLTPEMLCKISRLVFWVCGPGKAQAVDALLHRPEEIPAGLALADAPDVAVWYSPLD